MAILYQWYEINRMPQQKVQESEMRQLAILSLPYKLHEENPISYYPPFNRHLRPYDVAQAESII